MAYIRSDLMRHQGFWPFFSVFMPDSCRIYAWFSLFSKFSTPTDPPEFCWSFNPPNPIILLVGGGLRFRPPDLIGSVGHKPDSDRPMDSPRSTYGSPEAVWSFWLKKALWALRCPNGLRHVILDVLTAPWGHRQIYPITLFGSNFGHTFGGLFRLRLSRSWCPWKSMDV